jgi:hypothetical protein
LKAASGFLRVGGYLKMEIARLLTVLGRGAIEPRAAIPTGLAPQAYPTVAGIGAAPTAPRRVMGKGFEMKRGQTFRPSLGE